MSARAYTITSQSHWLEIDGIAYPTTFPPQEHVDPKVVLNPDGTTTLTYAALDEDAENPRKMFDQVTTMVCTDSARHLDTTIDEPEGDLGVMFEVAENLPYGKPLQREVYYLVNCGCYWAAEHTLEEVLGDQCPKPVEWLLAGRDNEHFPDGSSFATDFALGEHNIDGLCALLLCWMESTAWTTAFDLLEAFVKAGMPEVTAIAEWSIQGYSQGEWAKGYIYTTEQHPEADKLLRFAIEEYEAYFVGDVYMVVEETYEVQEDDGHVLASQIDYECVGGYYGDQAVAEAIKAGL